MNKDLIAQRYKPLFLRARGGFADVEVAWDTRLTRRVAIKRINLGNKLPFESLEEARTVALLSSPNIVNVYDFEQTGTETLMIMENVDGPTLAELMTSSQDLLDIDVATTVLDGIVAALEYAHENQVLHLDIKPANILIDSSGHVKVSDFGLAELAGSQGFGEVQGGTIGYMPPEQLSGGMVDARTDIWALAALSYQLLTGVNPFFALSPRESLQHITSDDYALPSQLRPTLNGSIDEALLKALSPHADDRPSSVTEFWLALRPHLGKIAPGRRRLKALSGAWAGREAAVLEGATTENRSVQEYRDQTLEEVVPPEVSSYTDEQPISIWNGNFKGSTENNQEVLAQDDSSEAERAAYKKERRAQKRAKKQRKRANRSPGIPLWQRLPARAQSFVARSLCALATGCLAWIALSALPYLNDPLAQAATAAAVNTGSPTPALLDAAFSIRLVITLLVAFISFIIPRVGVALAALCLVLGFFFTGNWLIGFLVLLVCIAWWYFIARQSPIDATLLPLSTLLALWGLPVLLPLFAGYFQSTFRALGTAAISCFICALLSLVSYGMSDAFLTNLLGVSEPVYYGLFSSLPFYDLLSISPTLMQMPDSNQLFIPLISLFTSLEFWLILASWLATTVVMSLLMGGKSRVKYVIATLCGIGILAAGYVLAALIGNTDTMVLLTALLPRLAIALIVCLLLIALGVQPKPYVNQSRGRRI